MKKYIKRYWWLLAFFIVFLIMLPKIVDFLFDIYLCRFTSISHINASDVLIYAGSLFSALIAIVSIFLALKQYKISNQTYIIPMNTRFFYYADGTFEPNFLSEKNDISRKDILSYAGMGLPLILQIKNIGKGTASNFKIEINYNSGNDYRSLMTLLGSGDNYGIQSQFIPEVYDDCGLFDSNEAKTLRIPFLLDSMINNLCNAQYANNGERAAWNNCLIRKKYKLAEIIITAEDILDLTGERNIFSYDLNVEIDSSLSLFTEHPINSQVIITFGKS